MELLYEVPRPGRPGVTAIQAVLKRLAEDGGSTFRSASPDRRTLDDGRACRNDSIRKLHTQVMIQFFLTDYTEEELKYCISLAYDDKFDTEEIATRSQRRRHVCSGAVPFHERRSLSRIWHSPSAVPYDNGCK